MMLGVRETWMSSAQVAARWPAVGMNRAAYMGVGPTERRTPITGIEIHDGPVVRRWGEWDITAHGPIA